jgi:abortive infection Abi-like protein
MKIAERTIKRLGTLITGDSDTSPRRSGPQLVDLFNEFGRNDVYPSGGGFPSRWAYAESGIREINGTPALKKLIETVLDPRQFLDTAYDLDAVLDNLSTYLRYDGFRIDRDGDYVRVVSLRGDAVDLTVEKEPTPSVNEEFIAAQITLGEEKIGREDYWGAITSARSLLEAVLSNIEGKLDPKPPEYDGDLPKLYKRVQKLLNLDPNRKDIEDAHKQILSGLIRVVNGLAAMRNKMSDAHAAKYKANRHHARMAVNAAKTVANFMFDTFTYQAERGFISKRG